MLTGIVALLLFDRFTDGSGMTAGLLAGLLGSLGAVEWWEARHWEAAERERGTRIFVMVRPDALSPRILPSEVFETPRPGGARDRDHEPSPFDLGVYGRARPLAARRLAAFAFACLRLQPDAPCAGGAEVADARPGWA